MKIKPQHEIWVTRDLQRIPVCEMSDDHIINALAMLKRKAERDQDEEMTQSWEVAMASDGMAAEDGGDVSEQLADAHWTRWGSRMWAPLFKDALRRGGEVAERAVAIL